MLHAGRLGRLGGEEHPSLALEAFKWAPQNQKQLMNREGVSLMAQQSQGSGRSFAVTRRTCSR